MCRAAGQRGLPASPPFALLMEPPSQEQGEGPTAGLCARLTGVQPRWLWGCIVDASRPFGPSRSALWGRVTWSWLGKLPPGACHSQPAVLRRGGIVSHGVNPRDQGRVQPRQMGKCGVSRTPRRFAARSDRGTVGASARGIPHSACHSERAQAREESPRPSVCRPAGAGEARRMEDSSALGTSAKRPLGQSDMEQAGEAQLTACHRQG